VIVLAHILGMPVEEFLIPWISTGVGAGMVMLLASIGGLVPRKTRRK
jgi:hypothetical protein